MNQVHLLARQLLDVLNLSAASGLITREALTIMGQLEQALNKAEGRRR